LRRSAFSTADENLAKAVPSIKIIPRRSASAQPIAFDVS